MRGTFPRPGAFVTLGGRTVKVLEAQVLTEETTAAVGTVAAVRKDGIAVGTPAGLLLLTRVQPENRAAMGASDFARGARLAPGDPATRPAE